jgi:hypothetical protein
VKTVKFKLTFNVEIDPQGEPVEDLRLKMMRVAWNALNNGTLTGDSPATVEGYNFDVKVVD